MKNQIKRTLILILLFSFILNLPSCKSVKAQELSEGYTRQVTPKDGITDEEAAVISEFGFSVFKKSINKEEANQLFSPFSALSCLALMANGASGDTLAQIEALLGCDIDELNEALLAYSEMLMDGKSPVNIANSIWINEGSINVKESFLQKNADYYSAQIYNSKFGDQTLKDINNWCDENTDGMIKKILENIDPLAVMYLMNALTFEAKWREEYEKDDIIEKYEFTNADKSKSKVTALASKEYTYLSDDKASGFVKAYKDCDFSFVALLPNEDVDIYDYIESLNADSWSKLWENKIWAVVHVRLPEFSYAKDIDLTDIMKSLGVNNMFSPSDADFSEMGTSSGNIYCGLFKQKTFIQVDRNGTKAAAVTIGGMETAGAEPPKPKYVYLNRPFVYAIVDNTTRLPIFIGCVTSLSE